MRMVCVCYRRTDLTRKLFCRGFRTLNSTAFANGENLVRFYLRESFDLLSRWPFHLNQFHGLHLAQPEMQAQVALRHDAGAAADFVHLSVLARDHANPSADSRPITLRSNQFDLDPILFV